MELRLFGKPQVVDSRNQARRDLPRKAAALLAMLALDGPLAREVAAARLWPDAESDKPRVNLRGLLRDLRALSGRDLVIGADVLELADGVEHDLSSAPVFGQAPAAASLLGAHEFGDLEVFDDWLTLARQRLDGQRKRAWREQAAACESAGRLADAAAAAEHLVEFDLLDESSHRLLMRLRYQLGDAATALAAHARCTALLSDALGVAPSAQTRALATLIEAGEPLTSRPLPAQPPSLVTPPVLVARVAECRAIAAAWRAGKAVWLQGEAGIGKSRLLAHLASQEPAGVRVSALSGDADSPYALLTRVLGALLDHCRPTLTDHTRGELARLRSEFGTAATRPARTQRMAEALQQALVAWYDAGLRQVLIDDLQWGDGPSAALLASAVAATSAQLHWLLAMRPGAGEPQDAFARLDLNPLDATGVVDWLRALPISPAEPEAWAAPLVARSSGNPLLLIETMTSLRLSDAWRRGLPPAPSSWPAPASLDALQTARLAQLSGPQLHLAQLLASAEAAYTPALAERLLGIHTLELAAHWHVLQACGVTHGDALVHDTLRGPLLGRLTAALRCELHGRIAVAADALGTEAAEVARHAWLGRQWSLAARSSATAAERALALNTRADERRLWDQAAASFERLGDAAGAFAARVRAFDAALASAPVPEATALAEALVRSAAGTSQALDAEIAMARALMTVWRHAEGLVHASRAVELAAADRADARALRASSLLAVALAGAGRPDEALRRIDADHAAVMTSRDARLRMDHLSTRGYVCLWATRAEDSLLAYQAALKIAEDLDDASEAAVLSGNVAVVLSRCGDNAAALDSARVGIAWRARSGDASSGAAVMAWQVAALLYARLSRWGEAVVAAEHATGHAVGDRVRLACDHMWATIWVDLGRPDRARECLAPLPPSQLAGRLGRALIEASIDEAEGRSPAPRLDAARSVVAGEPDLQRWLLEIRLAELAEAPQAVATCQAVAQLAARAGALAVQQSAWLREARALLRGGDPPAAAARLRSVLERLDHCMPADFGWAELWCLAVQVFEAAGRPEERDQALRSGARWLGEALNHVPAEHRSSFLAHLHVAALRAAAHVYGMPN